jgi:hypothetical protein
VILKNGNSLRGLDHGKWLATILSTRYKSVSRYCNITINYNEATMNWFVFLAGILYLGGTAVEIFKGNYPLATVFFCYMIANFVLARF